MSSLAVRTAIDNYLAANWTATPIVDAENQFSEPPQDLSPWLTIMYLSAIEQQPCLGPLDSNTVRKREIGNFNVIVFVASGTGTDVALQYAEDVRNLLRGQRGADLNGVKLGTVDPPDTAIPSQAQSSQGNFFGYAVSCEYEYDYF